MAYIKTLKDNELIGGTDATDVYPVSTTQAIFRQGPDGHVPQGVPHPRLEDTLQAHEEVLQALTTETDKLSPLVKDLQNQINGMQQHGLAVSNELGENPLISVSQKALTQMFGKLWSVLEAQTGQQYRGLVLSVSPDHYVGTESCTVHVEASGLQSMPLDHVEIYLNGEKQGEAFLTNTYTADFEVTGSVTVRCVARIMGVEYEQQQVVTRYSSFWLGGGGAYRDVLTDDCLVTTSDDLTGSYDVTLDISGMLVIIMSPELRKHFIRADMNGIEIPLAENMRTINGEKYIVFTSKNVYNIGTYNIDINR